MAPPAQFSVVKPPTFRWASPDEHSLGARRRRKQVSVDYSAEGDPRNIAPATRVRIESEGRSLPTV